MSTKQRYSTRLHSRRQMVTVKDHLETCGKILEDVGIRYVDASPGVSVACRKLIEILSMAYTMIDDVRSNI